MIKVAQSLFELSDSLTYLNANCGSKNYPTEFQTYDEAWEELPLSLAHLRKKLGEARYTQLVEMAAHAKAHYDAESVDPHQGFLGSWLVQDMGRVVRGKPPYAYPEELYRWPRANDN